MKAPHFILVGAPKSGTTSLCEYLNQHPQIFISDPKEPDHFGRDLIRPDSDRCLEDYLSLFENSNNKICGEGSTIYFVSKTAAQEIYEHNPNTKIIIMLREPVSLLYSLHSQLIFDLHEDIQDFETALNAEADRRLGKRIPKTCRRLNWLFYSDVVKFSENIQRYLDIFGKDNIHLITFDEFKSNTAKTYRETLDFLDVDTEFQPVFEVYNSGRQVKNLAMYTFFRDPPKWLFKLGNLITPPFLRQLRRQIGWNIIHAAKESLAPKKNRPKISPELELKLKLQFESEVKKLSALIQMDLSSWSKMVTKSLSS